MASARASQLANQRASNYNPYGSSGRVKLLSPVNTSISSIAKSTAANELNSMVSDYNAGIVSNADMLAFLKTMQTNPSLSNADQLQISNQIRDFNDRITQDKLVNVYKAAPDNTLAQYSAAQALASYWNNRAGTLQPDTPGYATAVDNASKYSQAADGIKTNIQKIATTQLMYNEEAKVNSLPDNTPEQAQAKIDMYQKLYNTAASNGDATNAARYQAAYDNAVQAKTQLEEKLTTASNKKTLSDYINTTLNDYHQGKIDGETALSQLDQASQFADSIGDTSTQYRLTNLSITINREIDKGITYSPSGKSTSGGSGDFVLNPDGSLSYGGTSSGGSGGSKGTAKGGVKAGGQVIQNPDGSTFTNGNTTSKSFSELDFEYKQNQIKIIDALNNGTITPEEFNTLMEQNLQSRVIDLNNIVRGLGQITATYGVDSKVGKKAVGELNNYQPELGAVAQEYNNVISGKAVLTVKNKNVTDAAGNSISTPQYDWVQKTPDMVSAGGIYYTPKQQNVTFDNEQAAKNYAKTINGTATAVDINGNPIDKNDKTTQVAYYSVLDANGKQATQQVLNVSDTLGNTVTYYSDPKYGWLPDRSKGPLQAQLHDQIVKETDQALKNGQQYTPNLLSYNQLTNYNFAANQPLGKTTGEVKQPEPNLVQKVIAPIIPKPQYPSAEQIGIPANQPLGSSGQQAIKEAAIPSINQQPSISGTTIQTAPQPVLKLATQAPSPVAQKAPQLQTSAQQNNIKPLNLGTPIPKPAAPQQSLSPIDWFKKLLNIK